MIYSLLADIYKTYQKHSTINNLMNIITNETKRTVNKNDTNIQEKTTYKIK